MSVMGELGDFHVAGIVQMLSLQRATGHLKITADGDEVGLFLVDGHLVQVSSNRLALRLGRVLEQRGLVSARQLRAALQEQVTQPDRTLGTILVERGWVTGTDIARCFEEQCILTLVRVMAASDGTFMYIPKVTPPAKTAPVPLNTDRILLEATRRVDELRDLRAMLPERKAPLSASPRHELNIITLQPVEERVIQALRAGATSVNQMADLLPYDEPTIMRTVIDLHRRGMIVSGYGPIVGEIGAPSGVAPRDEDVLKLIALLEPITAHGAAR